MSGAVTCIPVETRSQFLDDLHKIVSRADARALEEAILRPQDIYSRMTGLDVVVQCWILLHNDDFVAPALRLLRVDVATYVTCLDAWRVHRDRVTDDSWNRYRATLRMAVMGS